MKKKVFRKKYADKTLEIVELPKEDKPKKDKVKKDDRNTDSKWA